MLLIIKNSLLTLPRIVFLISLFTIILVNMNSKLTLANSNASFSLDFQDKESFTNYYFEKKLDNLKYVISPYASMDSIETPDFNFSQAYLDYTNHNFTLSLGRKLITYGPGRYGYPILGAVGGEAPYDSSVQPFQGYDQISYSFNYHLWQTLKLNYHKFYAWVPETAFRMLLGQRTTIEKGNFSFGFSETALVNKDASDSYYLPFPFIPIYFYQFLVINQNIPNSNTSGNMAIAFDTTWKATDNIKLYLEYYMDDRPWPTLESGFATPQWDRYCWRTGFQIGLEWQNAFRQSNLTLYTEYTRLNQYCYTSWYTGEWYPGLDWTYNGNLFGDPLGPDADRFNLELLWQQSSQWQWNFAYTCKRHGEGKIGDRWFYQPGKTEIFLTGIVEVTNTFDITLTHKKNNWEYSLRLGIANIDHVNNQLNQHQLDPRLSIWGKVHF